MGSIWLDGRSAAYPSIVEVLGDHGVAVVPYPGWETRSRGSGGFDALLGTVHHHTASTATVDQDLYFMVEGCDDAPVSNGLLDRAGVFHPIAAGASNHAGKGGPRGGIRLDNANATAFGIEAANSGLGETWPDAQLDAYLRMTRALHDGYALPITPTVMFSHHEWTLVDPSNVSGSARKIDPAGGQHRWPTVNSSATWSFDAYRQSALFDETPLPEDPMPANAYLYSDARYQNCWLMAAGTPQVVATEQLATLERDCGPIVTSTHEPNLASLCWSCWGLTVDGAIAAGYLVPR